MKRKYKPTRAGWYNCNEDPDNCKAKFETVFKLAGHIGARHRRFVEPTPIEHGTPSGYAKHLRREGKGKACAECRAAHAKYEREYRANRAKKEGQDEPAGAAAS